MKCSVLYLFYRSLNTNTSKGVHFSGKTIEEAIVPPNSWGPESNYKISFHFLLLNKENKTTFSTFHLFQVISFCSKENNHQQTCRTCSNIKITSAFQCLVFKTWWAELCLVCCILFLLKMKRREDCAAALHICHHLTIDTHGGL